MRRLRCESSSVYVHVTQRGLGRRLIFEDDNDRKKYLSTLKSKLMDYELAVFAWVLMGNHVHLLLKADPNSLSKFMQRVGISYAQYFNGRHGHTGKLFQNRFSSAAIDYEEHLLAAVRYIHRNPETAGICNTEEYPWSSYREIVGMNAHGESTGICDVTAVVNLFGSINGFTEYHNDRSRYDTIADISIYRPRISDAEAVNIARSQFGEHYSDHISTMKKADRDNALRLLKDLGLSVRQIERLTGIGRGSIGRA